MEISDGARWHVIARIWWGVYNSLRSTYRTGGSRVAAQPHKPARF